MVNNIIDYFNKVALKESKKPNFFLNLIRMNERKELVKFISPKKDDAILDAGCGLGEIMIILNNSGANTFGIDFCSEIVKKCTEKRLCVQQKNIEDFSVNRKFNKIVCAGIFEFCKNHHKALQNFRKCLKKEKEIILLLPTYSIFGFLYKFYHLLFNCIDIKLFNLKLIEYLLESEGYKLINVKNVFPFSIIIKARMGR